MDLTQRPHTLTHAMHALTNTQGSLSLALVSQDGVVLAGERRDRSPLLAPGPSPKIGRLDKHVAYIMSGIVPDGRYLVRRGRILAQVCVYVCVCIYICVCVCVCFKKIFIKL
jgi:20S proteasome alpha/beta subunit